MAIDQAQLEAIVNVAATSIIFTCPICRLVYSVPFWLISLEFDLHLGVEILSHRVDICLSLVDIVVFQVNVSV